ncbi:MAG TPA: glycosyltransferase [Ktedonobacterales bacterium]|jgi:glycosyltransferase involved in cell wall biosynthesis
MVALTPPLVSIVLPVYNGARYLKESIQSCLDQTYLRWELLIVDDASTDQTSAIIAEFTAKDDRVRYIRHETNKRLPAALNTGFAHAQGEYLTWTSDDNRYHPQALEEMVEILASNKYVDFVYTDYDEISETGQLMQSIIAEPPMQLIEKHTGLACFLYRRSLYEQIGSYSEDLFLAEDYDYWLRILASGFHMYPLHKSLYWYRRHPDSLTDEQRGHTFLAAERALLRNLPKMAWAGTAVQGKAYLYLASLAAWRGSHRAAFLYSIRAMRYAPAAVTAKVAFFLAKCIGHQR